MTDLAEPTLSFMDSTTRLTVPTREISGRTSDMIDMLRQMSKWYPYCRITYDEQSGVRVEFFGTYFL